MRKKQGIFGAVLLGFLGTIILAGGLIRLTTDDRKDSSGGSSGSSLPGVSDSTSSTDPVFDPYEGVSGNRTILHYDVAEENLTVSFKVGAEVERVVFSSSNEEEYIYEAHQDVTEAGTIEYTFETPGGKQVELFGLESIVERAFFDEKRLTYASFGNGVESIGKYAFHGSDMLSQVFFSNTINAIGYGAFLKSGITNIDIPDSVTTIERQAFMYCYSAHTVRIGAGVTEIPTSAFAYATGVTSLTIGENVETIGSTAFGGYKALTELVIPDSVKTISNSAFSNSDHIETLTIGSSVESIGESAFTSFLKVKTVYCRSEIPPTVAENVFIGWSSIQTIYVPSETAKTAYQAANGWSAFSNKIFVTA